MDVFGGDALACADASKPLQHDCRVGGGSWERDGHPWFAAISLTRHVGILPLKTAEDASSSGENGFVVE